MTYRSLNLMKELLSAIRDYVVENSISSVIWLGIHPWISVIIDFLKDIGVSEIVIMDNDSRNHGVVIHPYKCENESYVVRGSEVLHQVDVNTFFLMANSHYAEFSDQLKVNGISQKIENFYDKTLGEKEFIYAGTKFADENGYIRIESHDLKNKELQILQRFKHLCEEYNLRYWLGAGTLLGAIRHKGFIPWDDDVDVEMPYEDYLKLISITLDNDEYYLFNWRIQDDCIWTYTKLINKQTYLINDRWFPYLYTTGCYLDIFPVGGYPTKKEDIEKKWIIDDYLDRKWNYYYIVKDLIQLPDCRKEIVDLKFEIPFSDADVVGGMHRLAQKRWTVSKKAFESTIDVIFENDSFKAPIGYHEYLSVRYGNYMRVPPYYKRLRHAYHAFKKF